MHTLILVVIGLIVLALFVLVGRFAGGRGHGADGARAFVWIWLVTAGANGAVGVMQAGIPMLNEIGAFIPIFGVPALAAWYLSRRFGDTARP